MVDYHKNNFPTTRAPSYLRGTTMGAPSAGALANRRLLVYLLAAAGILSFLVISFSSPAPSDHLATTSSASTSKSASDDFSKTPIHQITVEDDVLKGGAIMPKLANETLKAELGRSAWKVLHTTMARFPDKPTQDEQTALFSYIHLFARLYPW